MSGGGRTGGRKRGMRAQRKYRHFHHGRLAHAALHRFHLRRICRSERAVAGERGESSAVLGPSHHVATPATEDDWRRVHGAATALCSLIYSSSHTHTHTRRASRVNFRGFHCSMNLPDVSGSACSCSASSSMPSLRTLPPRTSRGSDSLPCASANARRSSVPRMQVLIGRSFFEVPTNFHVVSPTNFWLN